VIVGVNKHVSDKEAAIELQRDQAGETEQKQRLREYVERRDGRVGTSAGPTVRVECEKLTALASSNARFGYCEQIRAWLLAGATEGEIVKALEQVWGRHRPRF
jgi:methylmalonyl-CoA mutase N-terminal domain/subunit